MTTTLGPVRHGDRYKTYTSHNEQTWLVLGLLNTANTLLRPTNWLLCGWWKRMANDFLSQSGLESFIAWPERTASLSTLRTRSGVRGTSLSHCGGPGARQSKRLSRLESTLALRQLSMQRTRALRDPHDSRVTTTGGGQVPHPSSNPDITPFTAKNPASQSHGSDSASEAPTPEYGKAS